MSVGTDSPVRTQIFTRSYVETVTLLPFVILMLGLFLTVWMDQYLRRDQKRKLYIIYGLVLSLILQNYVEYILVQNSPQILGRTISSVFGYTVRPIILAMFITLVRPDRYLKAIWVLIGINTAVHLTAFFSDIVFWFGEGGNYRGGPLNNFCLVVSIILFAYLLALTLKDFHPQTRKETWIPVIVMLILAGSLWLDGHIELQEQPIAYLTIGIVISCVFFYSWLHLQFVREHEQALQAQQRIQIMMSQIQPHFLFNTLNTICALCEEDPALASKTIEKFSAYLRQNLESLNQSDLIPLSKELEHTRLYTEIEMLRFPNISMEYRIEDEFQLPALSVQPLAENAIRHGVRGKKDGRVILSAFRQGQDHVVTIQDNGVGFDPDQKKNPEELHIGIENVRSRVKQMCGGELSVESGINKGTLVTIRIPDARP